MLKAVFIDFYGTVVFEDGEVIKKLNKKYLLQERRRIHQKSVPIYVVSNIDRADVLQAIEYHDLKPAGVFTSEDAKSYKPRLELFEHALNCTGLSADDVVHIGDSLSSDISGAASAGIKAIWVNRSHREVPEDVVAVNNLLEVFDTEYFEGTK